MTRAVSSSAASRRGRGTHRGPGPAAATRATDRLLGEAHRLGRGLGLEQAVDERGLARRVAVAAGQRVAQRGSPATTIRSKRNSSSSTRSMRPSRSADASSVWTARLSRVSPRCALGGPALAGHLRDEAGGGLTDLAAQSARASPCLSAASRDGSARAGAATRCHRRRPSPRRALGERDAGADGERLVEGGLHRLRRAP